ncbi:hypothetical protein B0T44_19820, partial [Nocardia donostiensis]
MSVDKGCEQVSLAFVTDGQARVPPPPPIPDAEKHLEAVVAELRGQHLADVMYYPLTIGDDGRLAEKWDFGDWHEPTMGVELTF